MNRNIQLTMDIGDELAGVRKELSRLQDTMGSVENRQAIVRIDSMLTQLQSDFEAMRASFQYHIAQQQAAVETAMHALNDLQEHMAQRSALDMYSVPPPRGAYQVGADRPRRMPPGASGTNPATMRRGEPGPGGPPVMNNRSAPPTQEELARLRAAHKK